MEVETHVEASRVAELLEQAVEGEELIIERLNSCEDGEVDEEIYEIIEEIEEIEEVENNGEVSEIVEQQVGSNQERSVPRTNGTCNNVDFNNTRNHSRERSSEGLSHYNVVEDWEDEDYQAAGIQEDETIPQQSLNNHQEFNSILNEELPEIQQNIQNIEEVNYDGNIAGVELVEGDRDHEIITSEDNNLVYTVLGNKNLTLSNNDSQSSDIQYITKNNQVYQVKQCSDASGQPTGTVYYESGDGEIYVQAMEQDEQQQFDYTTEQQADQLNQEWEPSAQNAEEVQAVPQQEQDPEQIFLHEDEDGQLYFKNDQGKLQPVYLMPDGNYAIAENSHDEDSQESAPQIPQNEPEEQQVHQQVHHQQSTKMMDNYVIPDIDLQSVSEQNQNEDSLNADDDSTVTISLIISEDEHGQKKTQVIIPSPANDLKCEICHKTFKTNFQLLKHNRLKHAREEDITTRNFPCDLCPKRFQDQNSLARHRKMHTEAKPFQCLECHKSFTTANILRKHLTSHNPNSHPLPCIYCGRRFSDKPSLVKHENSHLAAEIRTHTCDICNKCFSNPSDLNLHKKNHDPDKKFDCEVCGREFNRLNNLQRHMMVHQQVNQNPSSNDEILSCHVCGITYKFSSSLTRHMVTTHMNPDKLRQQAEEQRRKRENNYRRYVENRKTYETQMPKRSYRRNSGGMLDDEDDEMDE